MSTSVHQNNNSSSGSSREICKYFQHGSCRYGDSCFFSHQRTSNGQNEPSNESSSSNICKYYLQGRCLFGENCYNRHVRPSDQQSRTTSTTITRASQAVDSNESDYDDEINYENVGQAVSRNVDDASMASTTSSSSSSSTSPHSNPTTSSGNNQLVRRTTSQNKPKLRLTSSLTSSDNTNLSVFAKPFEPKNISADTGTPSSYFEALTGRPLNYADLDLDSSELNMFEPAYAEYLRRRKLASDVEAATSEETGAFSLPLCPYSEMQQECPFGEACDFGHALLCDQCQQFVLDPNDDEQQKTHRAECIRAIEADMEEAFATAASREKVCGICMEIVWDKEPTSERRFGILDSCNHIFCLSCIRKWRSSKAYENKVVKACPECRVKSDYVTPSRFWFDNEEAKKKIIDEYKAKLGKTHCKYFKQGDGTCPFGNKCFYLHQYKDGRLATDLPEPTRRRRFNRFGRLEDFHSLVRIEFDFSDDEDDDSDDDDFDIMDLVRRSFYDPRISDLFEFQDLFDNI